MKNIIILVMCLIILGLTQNSFGQLGQNYWFSSDTIDVWSIPSNNTIDICYHGHGIWLKAGSVDNAPFYDWAFPTGSKSTYIVYYDPQVEGEYAYYIGSGRGSSITYFLLVFHLPVTSSQNIAITQGHSYTIGSHTYTVAGTYVDTIPAVNTCDSIVTTHLSVITDVAEATDNTEISVKLCPNPASNFIQIQGYTDGFEKLEVYSQDGRLVMAIVDKNLLKSIDISMLQEGVYIIKFYTKFQRTAKPLKFIKFK